FLLYPLAPHPEQHISYLKRRIQLPRYCSPGFFARFSIPQAGPDLLRENGYQQLSKCYHHHSP
ncbi:MAG: hypothetical protein VYC44_05545, partial [Chloroflexota bacterium]|nr:hypothetical protein [Chloroflexota bacterium]